MDLFHTDLTNLTEARRFARAASGMYTLGKADKLRAFCDAALCEIREICVRQNLLNI